MNRDSEVLDKAVIFLLILVSGIILFTQYNFYRLSESSYLVYFSVVLILVLIGLLVRYFMEKKPHESGHHEHLTHEKTEHHAPEPWTFMEKLSYGMVALVAVLIIFNQVQISQASALAGVNTGLKFMSKSTKVSLALTGDPTQDALNLVISTGTPFYGESLGVTFDDPIKGLEIIAQLDPAYGRTKVQLNAEEKSRYISILTTPTITCEFCCGVKTAVNKDGGPACGCKHVWAIRGLAAYLIKNYPTMSDDEIKRELVKWKGLFFPKQMIQRYIQETQTGQYTPDIAALLLDVDEEKLKEMKSSVASDDSASGSSGVVSNIENLPSMVGGC